MSQIQSFYNWISEYWELFKCLKKRFKILQQKIEFLVKQVSNAYMVE